MSGVYGVTSYRGATFSERMATAPCAQSDPDLSFPGGKGKFELAYAQAKRDCARCPLQLREECLELALKTEGNASATSRFGVFGGLDPDERHALSRERKEERTESPHTAGHGTQARSRAHRRAGETPCGPCLAAETEAQRHRNQAKGWPKKREAA